MYSMRVIFPTCGPYRSSSFSFGSMHARASVPVGALKLRPFAPWQPAQYSEYSFSPLRRLRGVDRIRILGRLQRQQPVLEAPDRRKIDRRRRRAGAEGCVLVPLLGHHVVAVPVKLHALARLLQPDRGEVDRRIAFALRQLVDREVEQDLVRIERVVSPRTPFGVLHQRCEAAVEHQQALAHQRDGDRINDIAIEQPEFFALFAHQSADFRNDVLRRELRIVRAIEDELREAEQVEGVRRHAEHEPRLGVRARRAPC